MTGLDAVRRLKRVLPQYVAPPTACAGTEAVAAACGGVFRSLSPASRYVYQVPPGLSPELDHFYLERAEESVPPTFVAELPGGRVFADGAVLSPDGKTVCKDVSIDFGTPFEHHYLMERTALPRPQRVYGRLAVIQSRGGHQYYHWLFDVLPRLALLSDQAYDQILCDTRQPFQRESLSALNLDRPLVQALPSSYFQADVLVVPSLVGQTGHPTRQACKFLRQRFVASEQQQHRRVYVSRASAGSRRLLNENELMPELVRLGFEVVELERLPFATQVQTFAEAEIVVAPHGAGLANLVFCRPGTRVVELLHRSFVNQVYWQLSDVASLSYQALVSPGEGPLAKERSFVRRDFAIDIPSVLAALDHVTHGIGKKKAHD